MIRKFTLLLLLCVGISTISKAQLRDTVHISMPPYTDTSCPGSMITFWANVTGSETATYSWYINNVFTGVTQDSFFTSAPTDSQFIYCIIHFTNSFGIPDVDTSNWITVRRDTIPSRALISLVAGNNPYCSANPMTFFVYPVNGGRVPVYQWFVNGIPVPDSDSNFFSGTFADSSVISCLMIADTTCYSNRDSVYSNTIMVVRDSITAAISISNRYDTVCFGRLDTFKAVIGSYGSAGVHYQWYVDTTAVPGAIGPYFYTDSLHNGDSVYCILTSLDTCIRNKIQKSNVVKDSVSPILHTIASTALISGANPGCLDSPVTFRGLYLNFGISPTLIWFINGVQVKFDTALLDTTFLNGQIVTFEVIGNDRTCRDRDTLTATAITMVRDSTPVAPLISLIGDLIVANNAGVYQWYGPGGLIPGATGQTYHPTILGYYYCVLDTGNCRSGASNVLYVSLLGVNDIHTAIAKLYPNPTNGIVTLDFSGVPSDLKVDVYNIIGQALVHDTIVNESKHILNLSDLPNGNYFIVLTDKTGSKTTYKVLVQK